MKTSDFDYYLPEELIAQTPLKDRSSSRLMVVSRGTGEIKEDHFFNIKDYLPKNSILVINNTKVVPARIYGTKENTGAKIELLILKDLGENIYECLAKPSRRLHPHDVVVFGDNKQLKAEIIEVLDEGITRVKLIYEGIFYEVLDSIGEVPLPPYIHEKLEDRDRYQTVYSKNKGSSAAPTAGLHFTKELLDDIKSSGIDIVEITLTIGLGTFRPVKSETIEDHVMHSEFYSISEEAATKLNDAKKMGKTIVAVGTTSVRTLESNYKKYGMFKAEKADTSIFIYPGYKYEAIDELITNFHLPKSTLIMLVSALAGRELILKAYNQAVESKFRFFSFGDAMYIKK